MERLRNRKPPERTLLVRLDDSAVEAARKARSDLHTAQVRANAAEEGDTGPALALEQAEQRLRDAETALAAATVELTFRGMPRDAYEQLIAECPPGEDQAAEGQTYDPELFAPALVSACSVDAMPVEDARELLTSLSQLEAGVLFETCIGLNETARMDYGSLGNG
jgi:hypothetical protein